MKQIRKICLAAIFTVPVMNAFPQQQTQSLNLKHSFTYRPIQISLTPRLSTNGHFSTRLVNDYSLNLLGGYTGGVNYIEIGGLFNINKKNAQYVQAAGLFNAVGGRVKGFQAAGLSNIDMDTAEGFQAAGINNYTKGAFSGFQAGGVHNHVIKNMDGLQIAGISNLVNEKTKGLQIAGIVNFSKKEMAGVQISGILNYTKILKGVQIGLVNIADSSRGYSIGLLNIIKKGYHKLSINYSELLPFNMAFKTGRPQFYSILLGGLNAGENNKMYSFGYGLGSERALNRKRTVLLSPEISCQYLYLGSWRYTNLLNKLHLQLTIPLNKYVSLSAGPSFNLLVSDQTAGIASYHFPIAPKGYRSIYFANRVTGWFGWSAGINFF